MIVKRAVLLKGLAVILREIYSRVLDKKQRRYIGKREETSDVALSRSTRTEERRGSELSDFSLTGD